MASKSIYDHPRYYEILFGWDRSRESDFYHCMFERCGVAVGERVLEVACGTGQVGRLLARRGWRVTGLDIRPSMLAFAQAEATAAGIHLETLRADMTTFSAESKFAAAYNPMSSFRLLWSDAAADAHLGRVAAALRPGGVYVLDMDFSATDDEAVGTTDEPWEMTRGNVTVRAEAEAVYVNDDGVEHRLEWGRDAHLRGYTATAFAERVDATADLEIQSFHPESSRATGVSEFSVDHSAQAPVVGRTMVVVRRN